MANLGRGGYDPVWAPDGSALYFVNTGNIYRAGVSTDGGFTHQPPEALFPWPFQSAGGQRIGYDISADGRRFLATRGNSGGGGFGDVYVVVNWFDELQARMGEGN